MSRQLHSWVRQCRPPSHRGPLWTKQLQLRCRFRKAKSSLDLTSSAAVLPRGKETNPLSKENTQEQKLVCLPSPCANIWPGWNSSTALPSPHLLMGRRIQHSTLSLESWQGVLFNIFKGSYTAVIHRKDVYLSNHFPYLEFRYQQCLSVFNINAI